MQLKFFIYSNWLNTQLTVSDAICYHWFKMINFFFVWNWGFPEVNTHKLVIFFSFLLKAYVLQATKNMPWAHTVLLWWARFQQNCEHVHQFAKLWLKEWLCCISHIHIDVLMEHKVKLRLQTKTNARLV